MWALRPTGLRGTRAAGSNFGRYFLGAKRAKRPTGLQVLEVQEHLQSLASTHWQTDLMRANLMQANLIMKNTETHLQAKVMQAILIMMHQQSAM